MPGKCQKKSRCRQAAGFTIVELLVVVFIIAILISALSFAVTKAKTLARQTDCKSNMRQLGAAVLIYRSEHGGSNPPWLSCLYPDYVDDLHMFVCRSDKNHGIGRIRAVDLTKEDANVAEYPSGKYAEIIDNKSGARVPLDSVSFANSNVAACSYSYEFSAAKSSWKVSLPKVSLPNKSPWTEKDVTWDENKQYQLLHGDAANNFQPYSPSRMAMIRCYHHYKEGRIIAHPDNNEDGVPDINTESVMITINVAYAGNVYVGPLWWEGALKPGEQ